MTAAAELGAYITAVRVDEIFADHEYQRDVDDRVPGIAKNWDPRLVGVLELSDRGEHHTPRYAVVDGQHRWEAAKKLDPPPALAAKVHSGLTVAQEAALYAKLNKARKSVNTWDQWRARRAAGDEIVASVERIAAKHGLVVDMQTKDGRIRCTSTIEKLLDLGGESLVDETLGMIVEVWDVRTDAFDAPIVHGIGLIQHKLRKDLDVSRLADCLLDVMPRQLKNQAITLRDITTGSQAVLTAIAIMSLYNKKPGRKILVSSRTFGGGSRNARSAPAQTKATA